MCDALSRRRKRGHDDRPPRVIINTLPHGKVLTLSHCSTGMELRDIIRSVESSEERMVSDMCGMIRIPAMSPVNGGDGECARADFLQGILEGFRNYLL